MAIRIDKLGIIVLSLVHSFFYGAWAHANHEPVQKSQFDDQELISKHSGWIQDPSYLCGGYYQHPSWEDFNEPHPTWEVTADNMRLTLDGFSKLSGSVILSNGPKQFIADELEITRRGNRINAIFAERSMLYQDPDLKIWGSNGFWQAQPDLLVLQYPHYFYYPRHAHGQARRVTVKDKSKLTLTDASYTTCAPDKTTWALKGDFIELNQETGRGRAKHIRLKLKDQTVFYWPYLQFPIDSDRHSGFLYPHVGTTTQSGIELSWPFYWNIAPNYDATLTPRMLTARGLELQSEFRYLTRASNGFIQVHFLPNDQKYRNFRRANRQAPPRNIAMSDPRISALDEGNHRIGVRFKNHSTWSSKWNFNVDYTYVGDDNYFYDLENALNSANTTKLTQSANLQYNGHHWEHNWLIQHFQLLHPLFGPVNEPEYHRLPQWSFHGDYPKVNDFDFKINGDLTYFSHPDDPFTGMSVTQGIRFHAKPGLSYPYENWSGYFKPRIQLDTLSYRLEQSPMDRQNNDPSHINRIIPILDVDSTVYFDKYYQNGLHQTLEPRLYYLYVPYRKQSHYPNFDSNLIDFGYHQMFRDNRFSGGDRLGDTHQMTLALTTRLLNQKAQEKLRVTVGEIVYFNDRRVTLCRENSTSCQTKQANRHRAFSPIITNLTYTPHNQWYLTAGLEWDPNHTRTDKAYLSAQYYPAVNRIINFNYYWMQVDPFSDQNLAIKPSLHQVDTSIVWPIHKRWDFLGQYRYDIENKRMINLLAGLEYDTCCLAFQLVGNRYIRPNDGHYPPEYANGLFFQIMFKGLSTFGAGSADDKLRKAIANYPPFARKNAFKPAPHSAS